MALPAYHSGHLMHTRPRYPAIDNVHYCTQHPPAAGSPLRASHQLNVLSRVRAGDRIKAELGFPICQHGRMASHWTKSLVYEQREPSRADVAFRSTPMGRLHHRDITSPSLDMPLQEIAAFHREARGAGPNRSPRMTRS